MNNLLSYNEKEQFDSGGGYVEAPEKIKPKDEGYDGFPFVLYAIWAPNKNGYLAGIPLLGDDTNIVRDNELDYKQIKLFITEEKAQDFLDSINYKAKVYHKKVNNVSKLAQLDIETIKKLLIVRLNPAGWYKPMIHPN